MKSNGLGGFWVALGVLLLGAGAFMVKLTADPQGVMRALPYVCIGVGCGLFGHGMGVVLSRSAMKTNPAAQKKMEIEQGDERNIAIVSQAKAKAYDMMVFVLGALLVCFALMGVDPAAVLLLVFVYLLIVGYSIFQRCKLEKEM